MSGLALLPTRRTGLGFVAPIIDATMKALMLALQVRQQRDAATRAKHERERAAAAANELAALEASKLKALQEAALVAQQESFAQGAGGGAVTLSSSGRVLPAGGIIPGLPGGNSTLLLVGAAVVGLGLLVVLGRRA